MGHSPRKRVWVRNSKRRVISRWRTSFPVPVQLEQSADLAPSQFAQTRLPVPHEQSNSPLTHSGQGMVAPLLAGSTSTGLAIGTPCSRIPSKTSETLLPMALAISSALRLKKGFFSLDVQSATYPRPRQVEQRFLVRPLQSGQTIQPRPLQLEHNTCPVPLQTVHETISSNPSTRVRVSCALRPGHCRQLIIPHREQRAPHTRSGIRSTRICLGNEFHSTRLPARLQGQFPKLHPCSMRPYPYTYPDHVPHASFQHSRYPRVDEYAAPLDLLG